VANSSGTNSSGAGFDQPDSGSFITSIISAETKYTISCAVVGTPAQGNGPTETKNVYVKINPETKPI